MKWSWKIARIAGIDVRIHATFVLLLGYVYWLSTSQGGTAADAVSELVFVLSIFGIVVLHELGHAMAARRYGVPTKDITLLPIGGVARLERIPEDPKQEFVIAVAGPAVNVVLAMLCLAGIVLIGGATMALSLAEPGSDWMSVLLGGADPGSGVRSIPVVLSVFLTKLLLVNIMLILFNMLPAFPMDGGRVFRALLAMKIDYVRATRAAATIGKGMAALFAVAGITIAQPFLILIAIFVWIGAASEASMVETRFAMRGMTAQAAMATRFQIVAPQTTLAEVADHIIAGFQQDFPVVEEGRLVGLLTRADLLRALAENDRNRQVKTVMRTKFATAQPEEPLPAVIPRLQSGDCRSLPVLDRGRIVGIIDLENVGEFIALRSVLSTPASSHAVHAGELLQES
ncbi:MAG: site-2 protease family protein [Planctomycetota bacterium]|nr:MAG: site-2 protease family protein [Planctomycetota bacterium]REJ86390.1 MAG: site-2 protease family protein [Planctomycetota bacterium]REK20321.1 MAG: site-2 protease family protein [Planctomycetota bacterium]REK26818.1 MAG: site-2 protease family protein [Planctomycetota bacterium]